jgi:hypothetical protein
MAGPVTSLALILGALSAFGSLSIDMYLPSFQAISRRAKRRCSSRSPPTA